MISSLQVTLIPNTPTPLFTANGKTKIMISSSNNPFWVGGATVSNSTGLKLVSENVYSFDLENGDALFGFSTVAPVISILVISS
jgi:outer membrane protein assembly factor BamB